MDLCLGVFMMWLQMIATMEPCICLYACVSCVSLLSAGVCRVGQTMAQDSAPVRTGRRPRVTSGAKEGGSTRMLLSAFLREAI